MKQNLLDSGLCVDLGETWMRQVSVNKLGCKLNVLCWLFNNLSLVDFVVVIFAECCERK